MPWNVHHGLFVMKTLLAIAVLVALAAPSHAADKVAPSPKPQELRRHWVAVRSDATKLYEVVEVKKLSEAVDHDTYAVRDWRGDPWIIERVMDYERHTVTHEVRDPKTGLFVRLSYKLVAEGKTKTEFLLYFHDHDTAGPNDDVVIAVETPRSSATGLESEWKNREKSDDWRSELRAPLPTGFVDAIERMRDTLAPLDLGMQSLTAIAANVTFGATCDATPAAYAKRIDLDPDCAFDKDMGFACSDKQLQRVLKAAREGRKLIMY